MLLPLTKKQMMSTIKAEFFETLPNLSHNTSYLLTVTNTLKNQTFSLTMIMENGYEAKTKENFVTKSKTFSS